MSQKFLFLHLNPLALTTYCVYNTFFLDLFFLKKNYPFFAQVPEKKPDKSLQKRAITCSQYIFGGPSMGYKINGTVEGYYYFIPPYNAVLLTF